MTFLSIIIPFDNVERYLKDCLDGLAEQDLTDAEVILILNGNHENIDDLLKEYTFNIITKTFPERIGVAKARNEGLKIAKGEYVYFIDSDDYLYYDSLDKLVNVAKSTHADLINGERMATAFIRERFEERFTKKSREPLKKGKLSDMEFSMRLLVGTKTNKKEILSVLHSLIRKECIGDTLFDENERFYSDYSFLTSILPNLNTFIGVENALYAKRNRDDPINLTSLNQEDHGDPFLSYATAYRDVLNVVNDLYFKGHEEKYKLLKDEMAYTFFDYYYKVFGPNFLHSKDDNWRGIVFEIMQKISYEFNMDYLSFFQKREIKAFQQNNIKKLTKFIKLRVNYKKTIRVFKSRWRFKTFIYFRYYNRKPINDKQVMFASFLGKFYSDSPKYLYEYLYNTYGDELDYVWVINDKNVEIPGNPKKVKRFSLAYYKELARSKYWVINGRQASRLHKRDSQKIISTWHGTPLKKLGLDIGNVHTRDPNIKKSYIKVAKEWDYLISPNRYTTKVLRSAFAYDGEMLETGYPRNDILYNATPEQVQKIKDELNLPSDKKIVLYAPTWRDDEYFDAGKMHFNLKLELDKLQEAIGDEYIVLVRTHYFVADKLDLSPYEGFAYDVCRYDDIAELYLISDILITDYSSVFFDYANLRRPILYYTYDLDKYENVLRGFYIDIHSEVPGPLLKTTEEVIDAIVNIEDLKEEYAEKYDAFYERFCSFEDGNASKRIDEAIRK
ncbi:MAG: bifunctional glycosyltransferase family 2 protein/CDP-glycerol:glycerophosphate glycerophosphotransferase [Methanobrevibacter sp.]|uniref:bifunctional glycosyltransferase/CDP-glycerol:glycerophosphate glycerophosphotransferase n=1 Tax=Methanobrevibacter sp. TaxID=66852 RepID=UPI001B7CAD07|nr:bifunctional glycosyltransferase family 2 protein/CDP-glycerol:glycerophosphate glycerophosphotransferase [Methanobrevibacter sp.]MBP3791496.1 bifunctional glycosyltransferase family 2 protein/CDP-glycerol:glycerophosphate glycerophosphotransferase [Methanobrevibacter sp.]